VSRRMVCQNWRNPSRRVKRDRREPLTRWLSGHFALDCGRICPLSASAVAGLSCILRIAHKTLRSRVVLRRLTFLKELPRQRVHDAALPSPCHPQRSAFLCPFLSNPSPIPSPQMTLPGGLSLRVFMCPHHISPALPPTQQGGVPTDPCAGRGLGGSAKMRGSGESSEPWSYARRLHRD
jgi:hypothetical protein